MRKTLLLGNGINRLSNNAIGWDDVLENLAKTVGESNLFSYKDFVPFTLIYDGLSSSTYENSKRGITPLKERVAQSLGKMQFNHFHEKVMSLGIKHIITTNYDYCLENSCSGILEHDNIRNETRYSVYRRTRMGESFIWHIHGEIDKPETITLGHEQYAGQLEHLRDHLTSATLSPLMKNRADLEKTKLYSWGDVFLRDEIHMVGFSLDYSEIDIWWLLVFKAQYQSRYRIKCGPTHFHYWANGPKSDKDEGKIKLLESLKVNVIPRFDIDDYPHMYNEFLDNFNTP